MNKAKIIFAITTLLVFACNSLSSTDNNPPTQSTPTETSSLQPVPIQNEAIDAQPSSTESGILPTMPEDITSTYWFRTWLESQGYSCNGWHPVVGFSTLDCIRDTPEYYYDITLTRIDDAEGGIFLDDAEGITACVNNNERETDDAIEDPNDEGIVSFLGYIATLPITKVDPKAAYKWVENSLRTINPVIASTEFGGVKFRLHNFRDNICLFIGENS